MKEWGPEAVLETVRQELERALCRLEESQEESQCDRKVQPLSLAAKFSLQQVINLIDRAIENLTDAEATELAAVYGLIAEQCASVLDLPKGAMILAEVLELCGALDNNILTAGLPEANHEIVAMLRQSIVWITVSYDVSRDGLDRPCSRSIEILYGADQKGVRSKQVRQELSWEELPADVREQILGKGKSPVMFKIFPKEL